MFISRNSSIIESFRAICITYKISIFIRARTQCLSSWIPDCMNSNSNGGRMKSAFTQRGHKFYLPSIGLSTSIFCCLANHRTTLGWISEFPLEFYRKRIQSQLGSTADHLPFMLYIKYYLTLTLLNSYFN